MRTKPKLESPLQSKTIALPESRQLDVLAALFERRGARVLRIPLISIHDSADQNSVHSWLQRFINTPPDYLIVLTGEGLRRLSAAAERNGIAPEFLLALGTVSKICRGPKPGRVLRELELKAEVVAKNPTTAGIIETLQELTLANKRIAVQLYGDDPNQILQDYLAAQKLSHCDYVAPYRYASASDNNRVIELIQSMAADEVDVMAFTSQPQVKRLATVAKKAGLEEELASAYKRTKIAAIGPVVRDLLNSQNVEVSVMPEESYFMKPLVRAIETLYE